MSPTELAGEVQEWRDLLARHAALTNALERELQARHDLGMSEYEVLERLASEKECAARVQQLAGEVHLSQSALSRVINRLELAGLVQRKMCPDDRRGIFVQLSAEGERKQAEAEPTHRAVLRDLLHASPVPHLPASRR
jgi:DNA-binding MarR family transcriptional regulator